MKPVAENEREGEVSEAVLLALSLSMFVMLCVGAVFLPHDPYLRYQQLSNTLQFRLEWVYDRIHHDPTPIDVALVGVSRTQASISAPKATEMLSQALGREVEFANLSMPQQGRNAHFAVVRQLLDTRPETQVLVLSVVEQMPRMAHPAYRNIAEAEDIIRAPILINYNYFSDLAFLPWRQTALTVQQIDPGLFGAKSRFDPSRYEGTRLDSTLSYQSPTGSYVDRDKVVPKAELDGQTKSYLSNLSPSRLSAELVDYEFAGEKFYLRKIVELARERDVQIVFLYLPIYKGPTEILDDGYDPTYGPLLSATFIVDEPTWFSDYGHLNRYGSPRATKWFSDGLVDLIERDELKLEPRSSQGTR